MSTTAKPTPESLADRSARATTTFCEAVGVGHVSVQHLKLLTIALAEQGAAEVARNPEFAQRVRVAFQSLVANPPQAARRRTAKDEDEPLEATGPIDPALRTAQGRQNPYLLYRAYGETQTRRLLENRDPEDLKRSVAIVQAQHPGTAPRDRRYKANLVNYIMEHVIRAASGD